VEDVWDVARPVGNPTGNRILTLQDERFQVRPADPVQLGIDDVEGGEDPPGVADIFQFLGPAIKATTGKLSPGQPLSQLPLVDEPVRAQYV